MTETERSTATDILCKAADTLREIEHALNADIKTLATMTDTRYTQALFESVRRGGAPVQIAPRP